MLMILAGVALFTTVNVDEAIHFEPYEAEVLPGDAPVSRGLGIAADDAVLGTDGPASIEGATIRVQEPVKVQPIVDKIAA